MSRHIFLLGVILGTIGPAAAGEECRNELQLFEHDVRNAREIKERVLWQLAAANYQRRVIRYCAAEERRSGVAKLKLTDDELKLLGVALE